VSEPTGQWFRHSFNADGDPLPGGTEISLDPEGRFSFRCEFDLEQDALEMTRRLLADGWRYEEGVWKQEGNERG
jgi:hypothetical protein